jgi:Tol biopolymer transport system component/DNA-binding CsgD family transcriptional regulator
MLTPREQEVHALLRDGLTNPEIAERLGITRETAKHHVSEIISKLGVTTREEAAVWRPEPPAPRPRRRWWAPLIAWLRPLTLAKAAGLAASLAVAAAVAVLAWGVLRTSDEGDASQAAAQTATPTPENSQGALATPGPTAISDIRLNSVTELLEAADLPPEPAAGAQYFRGLYSINPDGSDSRLLAEVEWPAGLGTPARPLSISADGSTFAYTAGHFQRGMTLYVGSTSEGVPEPILSLAVLGAPVLSPDGSEVLIAGSETSDSNEAPQVLLVSTTNGDVSNFAVSGLEMIGTLEWSPKGDRIAFFARPAGTSQYGVHIVDRSGRVVAHPADGGGALAWSPDGSRLAMALSHPSAGIHIMENDGNLTRPTNTVPSGFSMLDWSPDGSRLLFTKDAYPPFEPNQPSGPAIMQITALDLQSAAETPIGEGTRASWSFDASRVAFVRDGNIYTVGADGIGEQGVTNATQPLASDPAWLPDGRLLFSFASGFNGSTHLVDIATGEEINLTVGNTPLWSPDGQTIALVGAGDRSGLGGRSDIYVMNRDGTAARSIGYYGSSDVPSCYTNTWSWSPDGRFLAYSNLISGELHLAVTNGRRDSVVVTSGCNPAWSPKGDQIAFVTNRMYGWEIFVADPLSGGAARRLTSGELPSWSPDGQRIAFYRHGAGFTSDLYVIDSDGTDERRLAELGQFTASREKPPRWSLDGSFLLTETSIQVSDQSWRTDTVIVDTVDGIGGHIESARAASWSPDGALLAYSIWDQQGQITYVIELADIGRSDSEPLLATRGYGAAWSPDGKTIAVTR